MKKVAVLVDGGFYRKRAKLLWGEKSERLLELAIKNDVEMCVSPQLKVSSGQKKAACPTPPQSFAEIGKMDCNFRFPA